MSGAQPKAAKIAGAVRFTAEVESKSDHIQTQQR